MVEYHAKTNQDFTNLQESFLGVHWSRGIVERVYSDCGSGRIGKFGRMRNLSTKNQCQRSIDLTKGRRLHIPSRRWYSKFVRKRLRIPRTPSMAEAKPWGLKVSEKNFKDTGSQPAESKDDAEARRDFLVCSRWFHLSSSQCTSSSTLHAERRNIVSILTFRCPWIKNCCQTRNTKRVQKQFSETTLSLFGRPRRRFVQGQITRFRTTSDSICDVQPRFESRSNGTELPKIQENGKTTYWPDDQDAQFQSPKWKNWNRSIGQESKLMSVSAERKVKEWFRWKATGQCSCRQIHLPHATFSHAQPLHSTDDMCAWLKFALHLNIGHSSTRHVSSCASQYTEHQHKFSLTYFSCAAVFYLLRPRLVVHASILAL